MSEAQHRNRAARLANWLQDFVVTNAVDHARAMRDIRLRAEYEAAKNQPVE